MTRLQCRCSHRNWTWTLLSHRTPPQRRGRHCLCLHSRRKEDEVAIPVLCQQHWNGKPHLPSMRTSALVLAKTKSSEVAKPWQEVRGVETRGEELRRSFVHPHQPGFNLHSLIWQNIFHVQQKERGWGCNACVCAGTWTLLSHPHLHVSAQQKERWWGCNAGVCTGTWTLLSHPTRPHPTPPHPREEDGIACVYTAGRKGWGCNACLCAGTRTLLSHPSRSTSTQRRGWHCLCLHSRRKEDEVAIPVLCQQHWMVSHIFPQCAPLRLFWRKRNRQKLRSRGKRWGELKPEEKSWEEVLCIHIHLHLTSIHWNDRIYSTSQFRV